MIKWKLPTEDTPGLLRRRKELAEILDMGIAQEATDRLVKFLEPFIETKKGVSRKDQVLDDMSQEDYSNMILVIMGYKSSVSDPKEESSELQ